MGGGWVRGDDGAHGGGGMCWGMGVGQVFVPEVVMACATPSSWFNALALAVMVVGYWALSRWGKV